MPEPSEIAERIARRDRRALARLLTWIEAADPRGEAALSMLEAHSRSATVGITGPPGAGKSTLTSSIVTELRSRGATVAVLAVDPSSPYTGGALLGDRIRMTEHTHDEGVFVRSMAARGQLGGLAPTASDALRALEAFGFDWVLVETVGVGQGEVEIVTRADSVVVVLIPGMGDDVQAGKAGLLEIADVFAVNKADRPGATSTADELRAALSLGTPGEWDAPVVPCVAIDPGGSAAVVESIDQHRAFLERSGDLAVRRADRRTRDLRVSVRRELLREADNLVAAPRWQALVADVAAGKTDPGAAAREIAASRPADATVGH